MMKNVIIIPAEEVRNNSGGSKSKLRVAAYCRVSTDEERQLESFENQVGHYTNLIAENSHYKLVKIYSDEGISGCSTRSRKGFQSMIEDCEAGLIDLVITKSISRFARNTQDSLAYTRKLKDMGIGIYFEKEGINTLESSGELLLTLFSCFAQEESRSISENTAWGIRSRFRQGIPHLNTGVLLGYDKDPQGKLVINEDQAETVRRIYRMFLERFPLNGIAAALNKDAVPGVHGEPKWCATTIGRILRNEKYKGALLMQKTFTSNYLTKQHILNTGQLDQYYIEANHPAIISPEEWAAVQEEVERRRAFRVEHGLRGLTGSGGSSFYAKLFCETCKCKLQRIFRKGVKKPYWLCTTCGNRIDDSTLRARFCDAFNRIVARRDFLLPVWESTLSSPTSSPLEKVRARQMIDITAGGLLLYEVPELTQAILQEAWLSKNGDTVFTLLSGEKEAVGNVL